MNTVTPNCTKEPADVLASLVDHFCQGLNRSDCIAEAWIAFIEAEQSYHSFAGCCTWNVYLSFRVQERLAALRQARNQHIQLQSPFSLDQSIDEKGKTALDLFPSCQGNFEGSVLFWDYVRHLDSPLREMAQYLAQGDSREEVMAELGMDQTQFDFWRDTLREELELSYL